VNYSHEENMNTPAQQPREICEHDAITKAWHDYHGPIHMEGEEDYVPAVPPLFMRGFVDGVEYAKRERDEARSLLERKWDKEDPPLVRMMRERDEAREESLEQARLLGKGGSREARLITERDHYKEAIEEISVTIQDWLDSIVQEPSLDFIHAIKAWADKKLNNG
jgi:hypothetical protein